MAGRRPTGLGSYLYECAKCLSKNFPCTALVSSDLNLNFEDVIRSPFSIGINNSKFSAIKRLLFSYKNFPNQFKKSYSPTHHGLFRINESIITIHDLIPLKFPKQNKLQYLFFRFYLPKLIKASKAIFTVSNYSKNEIIKYYDVVEEKMYVIPYPINLEFFKPGSPNFLPSSNFLLVVGATFPHKNVEEIIINHKFWVNNYYLKILSPSKSYKRKLLKLVKRFSIMNKVKFIDYLSKDELLKNYQKCSALIYPSLEEGFGIPPLEAMACGKPIIVSDIPVHKENLGEIPFFISPGKIKTWEEAFSNLHNKNLVETKINQGLKHIKKYNYENFCANLIHKITKVFPDLGQYTTF